MLDIRRLDDVRGNNTVIYSIKILIERKCFPKLSIMSGVMGVGKTSVAKVVAGMIDETGAPVKIYNCGMSVDMAKLNEEVFALAPAQPKVFIFEELHGLSKSDQSALLQMFDSQSSNTYIICTTTEIHKILRTIRSRAQVWEFKLLSDKQCAQLLDDYLTERGIKMDQPSKTALLRSCHGVPRDLIKNIDFAIAGDFDSIQLDTLLGNVSDELLYSVFVALKTKTSDFASRIDELMDEVNASKLAALNDFWVRFLMERSGVSQKTLSTQMITTLNAIFDMQDIMRISKVLLHSRVDTVLLELLNLNMELTTATASTVLGIQKEDARIAERDRHIEKQTMQSTRESAQLTRRTLENIKL